MRNLYDIFNTESPSFHMDVAMESINDGNEDSAKQHIIELLYEEVSQLQSINGNHRLFRFVGLPNVETTLEQNPLIQDILNNRITLSNPSNFNDPMDPLIKEWLLLAKKDASDKIEKKLFKSFKNSLRHFRICSLCGYKERNFIDNIRKEDNSIVRCSPLMWAHYARMHNGICIEYEITPECIAQHNDNEHLLRLLPVRYRDHKALSGYITIDNAFTAKADCWSYEQEARLIYFTKSVKEWKEPNTKNISDFVTLYGFPVKAVYFGCKMNSKEVSEIKKIVKVKGTNINMYEMSFNHTDITQLEEKFLK